MPKIKVDRTIQYKRATYKVGDIVECSVGDVESLSAYGTKIDEEEQKMEDNHEKKKSTNKSTKRVDK